MNLDSESLDNLRAECDALRTHIAELEDKVQQSNVREQALLEEQGRWRIFADNVRDVIWTMDLESRFTYISPSVERLRGYTPEEVINSVMSDTMPERSAELVRKSIAEERERHKQDAVAPGHSITLELELYKKCGGTIWAEVNVSLLYDADGKLNGFMGVTRDISERKQAEADIRKWAHIFEHADWGIAICDGVSDELRVVNAAYARMHGYTPEQLIGKSISTVYASGHFDDLMKQAKYAQRLGRVMYETKHKRADGTVFPVHVDASSIRDETGAISVWAVQVLDISERKRGEEALRVASRMEATSTLAGGIAHDFNNLMVGVLANASLVQMELGGDHPSTAKLREIELAAEQAGDLAQQLLAFARGGKYAPRVLNLNQVLQEIVRLQEHTIPPRIELEHDLADDLWNTHADATQLGQIIMNLSINAVEATEGRGRIRIATRNIDAKDQARHDLLKERAYVCLTVEDEGSGIASDALEHVFEPFYSTRAQGRGLGLAAAYGIVKNHDGFIFAENRKSGGARLTVYLPATEDKIAVLPEKEPRPEPDGETILIIDDEPVVLNVTRDLLERFGYTVLCAEDGQSGIDIAREHDGEIHATILDMGMPDMSGSEVFPHLRELRPDMKIIICTGYELSDASQSLLDQGAAAFVRKPYRPRELNETIRDVLSIAAEVPSQA